jgi:hypothetical protein
MVEGGAGVELGMPLREREREREILLPPLLFSSRDQPTCTTRAES